MDITTRLREVPTMGHDAGCIEEAALEIEKLREELKKRDKCAFMGAMRDCPTHGESEEIKRLQKLATCECGDEFTEHDPGTCVNCLL